MSQDLETAALEYLRYKRRCLMVCTERHVSWLADYRPDVLGITQSRRRIEIEIKRTVADFRANKRKYDPFPPNQRYFLVPQELTEAVRPLLPDGWGLAQLCGEVEVVVKAPVLNDTKVSALHLARMCMNQAGTLCSLMRTNTNLQNQINTLFAGHGAAGSPPTATGNERS